MKMLKVNDKLLINLADDADFEYRMDHTEPENYVLCNGIGLDGKPYRLWYYVSDELFNTDNFELDMIDYTDPSSIEDEYGTCVYFKGEDDKIEEISISCTENDIVKLNEVYEEYKTFTLEDKLQAVDVYDVERGDVYKPITDEEQYQDRQYNRAMYLKVITDTKKPVAELPDYVWQESLITINELEARTLISQGVKVGYSVGPIYHGSHEDECYYHHISTQSELDDFIGKIHITKAQLSVSPAYVLSKDEIISRDYDVVKKIAEYENANKVPPNERVTEWFGDYAMYVTKSLRYELKPNQVLEAYRKAIYTNESIIEKSHEQVDSRKKTRKDITTKINKALFDVDEDHTNVNKYVKAVIVNFGDERGDVIVKNDNFGTSRKYADFTNGKKEAGLNPLQIAFSGVDVANVCHDRYIDKNDNVCTFGVDNVVEPAISQKKQTENVIIPKQSHGRGR